ncbi:hypothetical protein ABZ478_06525 [Streptomyces sp. NPDC005706]|uniref:hypothetical protein n=1 Tax=Streptomyces sp. NPDC005706 TaxID=3157169 RepID=UPI0033CB15AF
MNGSQRPYFLLIGTDNREFSDSKLKVSGARYRRKSLYSDAANWEKIIEILEDPSLTAVIGKLTGNIFNMMAALRYRDVAARLFAAIGKKPNLIMVHKQVLEGEEVIPEPLVVAIDDDLTFNSSEEFRRAFLAVPSPEVRTLVLQMISAAGVSLLPYTTNAEMATLSGSFIDDHENNLLFRIYVPTGRLYASEADRLLSLFHDWLTQVGRHSVRQDGYSTASGHVYEFYGDESLLPQEMSRQFSDFSAFLDLCAKDPDTAEDELRAKGIERVSASSIVTRYGKSVRRINTDLRHERESRMLAIRHRLESELLELSEDGAVSSSDVEAWVDSLTPVASATIPMGAISSIPAARVSNGTVVTINQQIFHGLQGSVVQNIQGTVNLGAEAKELLELISTHGGDNAASLETSVHELEDPDARQADRLSARAKLSAFLLRLGGAIESASIAALQKYVESKLGV